MKPSRKLEAGAVVTGLVALHEHNRDLKQQRRLAGKPSFSDQVPFLPFALVILAVVGYAAVLLVLHVWPYLLTVAVLVTAALLWRRHRRARHR